MYTYIYYYSLYTICIDWNDTPKVDMAPSSSGVGFLPPWSDRWHPGIACTKVGYVRSHIAIDSQNWYIYIYIYIYTYWKLWIHYIYRVCIIMYLYMHVNDIDGLGQEVGLRVYWCVYMHIYICILIYIYIFIYICICIISWFN